jgi:hypothetical protein
LSCNAVQDSSTINSWIKISLEMQFRYDRELRSLKQIAGTCSRTNATDINGTQTWARLAVATCTCTLTEKWPMMKHNDINAHIYKSNDFIEPISAYQWLSVIVSFFKETLSQNQNLMISVPLVGAQWTTSPV